MAKMRAKMTVRSVTHHDETSEALHLSAVTGKDPSGPDGESEDNTYARYTPSAELTMCITSPTLIGRFKQGDTFYVDFTPAD